VQIYRLADSHSILLNNAPAKLWKASQGSEAVSRAWRLEHVSEPDVGDKETVLSLAKMSSDAYLFDEQAPDWLPLNSSAGFNLSSGFGWQDNKVRGHVFADTENSTVIIAIKGTSACKHSLFAGSHLTDVDTL
jgi:lipase ATG15